MECLPGISPKYFLSPLVTVPVAPMATGITEPFLFHIRWISMHTFLYFNFFSVSICVIFLIIIIFIINHPMWRRVRVSYPASRRRRRKDTRCLGP
jgi:uncharacterized membrane protein